MPARQRMTLIEFLIVMAIFGILAAIAIPAMEQARQRARAARSGAGQAPAFTAVSPDGQLNTIEVSELARDGDRARPEQFIGVVIGLVPVVVGVAIIYAIVSRLKRQMARRVE